MEFAMSVITGDLYSRFISVILNKCTGESSPVDKIERLQQLLLRLHIVVEEAEGRYITNSHMLVQLGMITEAMYRGYHALQNIKPSPRIQAEEQRQVSRSSSWFSICPVGKRFRKNESMVDCQDIQGILGDLETTVANMQEFVILLGGCERMCQRPYDTYLYIDNFMFGRVVQKPKIINILVQKNHTTDAAPVVLPVIGGYRVGKKTLVWSAWNDNKVRSYFPSILHLKGDDIWRMDTVTPSSSIKTLVVIEFASDISDDEWESSYSLITTRMGKGSKIIIVSRLWKVSRFGTVKPIHLTGMSPSEYSYLFKVLAFGSANPEDYPQLAAISQEFGTLLGGLLPANAIADMLRKKLDVQYWTHILSRYKKVVKSNFSVSGAHPKALHENGHSADITKFALTPSSSSSTLRIMPVRGEADICAAELSGVTFGNLVAGSCALQPQEKMFQVMVWESRLPPFTKFVATCVQEEVQCTTASTGEKRPRELDG